ncbi:DEAD/DEAH box helicase [Rhodoferax sp. AJA081-3]|uniref:DEAD/DEAH box helicase n=1 Tax=Rhodoferax sp. AJA081-3 TaxID=2752316 RepID=UPI001ADF5D4B|nr:DEAD/DEAH box helicase [Rhodoferax sp. AJA081-3]QTN26256.1 DEAD/DEAH box helicase [Rhodoferax sp. AJA081-3]
MPSSLPINRVWFNPNSLEKLAANATWTRGRLLYSGQKVLELQIAPADGYWLLTGEVQGSERWPYTLTVELTLTSDGEIDTWDADCSCPVGYNCKHGVALTLKAAYQGLRLLGSEAAAQAVRPASRTPPTAEELEAARLATQARLEDIQRKDAEAQLLTWFYEIDRASGNNDSGSSPGRVEQYLFLLKPVGPSIRPQQLRLEAAVSSAKANGEWAKPKAIRTPPRAGQAAYDLASETDREVLQLLLAMPDPDRSYYSAYSGSPGATPCGHVGLIALQQAASTGRLYSCHANGSPDHAWQWGPPRTLDWGWHEVTPAHGGTPGWTLRARLHDAPATAKLFLNTPPLYLDSTNGLCGVVQVPGMSEAQLAVLLKTPVLQASALKKHQVHLMQRLGKLPAPPMLENLVTVSGIPPTACLHLSPNPPDLAHVRGLIQAQLRFEYQGYRGWWAGQGTTVVADGPQGRALLHRDAETELEAITRLMNMGLVSAEGGIFGLPGDAPQHTWLQWADADYAPLRAAGFEVTLDDALKSWITHADALQVQLQPQGQGPTSPWFDLSLGMEINGQRHNILPLLPDLIAAAASSPINTETGLPEIPPYVYLPNQQAGHGGFIRLPTDTLKPWMAALLELVGDRAHDFTGDSLKLSRLDALRITAALGEGAVWDGAAHLREMVQRLSGRAEMPEVAVPTGVHAELRPYQQQGLNWLQFLREHGLGGILADDMGLGKTLQTLAHIQVEKDAGRLTHPALIIAPVSLMGNWRREAERFCPELRTLVLHGKERHDAAHAISEHDIVIAPYSLLQRDKERWLEAQWHIVVLDEAQNIKNASTHAAQVVGQLQTHHRLCLSGTPMENHLGEIWSLFHFLMPGFLGSQARFKELFRTPIEKLGDPERLQQLRARITPFMLRRTKALVAHELPPKVETIERVELSGKQADLYETIRLGMEKTVREALNTKGLAKSQITILDALMKLRQVCCDPRLLKLAAAQKVKTSAKLEQLMELLPEMVAEGRRILLFSQFTSMLTLIEAELKQRGIPWVKLTGQSQNRDALIEQFTSGAVPLFLISLKAGGVGLNLPQADTVIHYDPWWNPAVENQATDRAHRIGQTQTVFVYKLVAQGTIEERILALQERKAALADSMYSGSTGRKQPLFTEGDLAELLKPLSE